MNIGGNIKPAPAYECILLDFAGVRPHAVATRQILSANIFLILVAFCPVKPMRDGCLSVTETGAMTRLEGKACPAFEQGVMLGGSPLFATRVFHLGNAGFVIYNTGLVLVWIALSTCLHRQQRSLEAGGDNLTCPGFLRNQRNHSK